MKYSFFLKLSNKQILIFLLITSLAAFIGSPFLGFYFFSFLCIIMILSVFCWYYSVGYICNKLFPISSSRHLFFLLFMYYILVYFLIVFAISIIVVVPQLHEAMRDQALIGRHKPLGLTIPSSLFTDFLVIVIVVLQLIMMIAVFYIDFYISKSIAEIQSRKNVIFEEYSNLFFYLWIIPIGFWFLQPKVNKIYEQYLAEIEQKNK